MKNLTTFIIDLQPEIVEALACIGSAVKTKNRTEIKKALSNYSQLPLDKSRGLSREAHRKS